MAIVSAKNRNHSTQNLMKFGHLYICVPLFYVKGRCMSVYSTSLYSGYHSHGRPKWGGGADLFEKIKNSRGHLLAKISQGKNEGASLCFLP